MNLRQKKMLKSWLQILLAFAKREWFSVFMSSGLGVLVAQGIHLILRDHTFQDFLASLYKPKVLFDDPQYYVPYLAVILIATVLAIGPFIFGYISRGISSWWTGVSSGLVFLPFASALFFALIQESRLSHPIIFGCKVAGFWFVIGFALHLAAMIRRERTIREEECTVPMAVKSVAGSQIAESDDPIESWEQDALGRAALVDSLSVKILIGKAPVLTLSGPFGSGKTSTLNLLRQHLGNKTITVSFSTWLPGSEATLTSYLMTDIATECSKKYIVPGLRQSARRFTIALGQTVPVLSRYLKLLPAPTQKDDIDNLKFALQRLPKRVVVLLDEIDRMEKDELATLLKVIRGISTLPNLSFVCAGDRNVIIETVKDEVNDKSNEYFEKFYPVLIQVPEPDPAALKKAGADRLVAAFTSRDWFENDSETKAFRDQISDLWDERIAPFCRNLRAIGSLANDIGIAAAPLKREVDPIDLTFVELLRRFKPAVYDLVAKNSVTLTGGETLLRGGPYQTDDDKARSQAQLLADLKKAVSDETDLDQVKGVLCELFPEFLKTDRRLRPQRPRRKDPTEESDKRISEPGIFPAYFRYELPEAIFSSTELAFLEQRLEQANTQVAREKVFLDALESMERGSLKRDDFLRKLAGRAKFIAESSAKSLGLAAVKVSANYTYDMMPQFGEAGHVLKMIHAIAVRLLQTERVTFLQECILDSNDDTMAFNIFRILTNQEGNASLKVTAADLYKSFAARMRKRYGRNVDAANFDFSTSDTWALEYWGRDLSASGIASDPEDRKIQHEFWLRYIGTSRAHLAHAFRDFFMPVAAYSTDPAPLVENRISVQDLKRLYEELPEDASLTSRDQKSLDLLRRFLAGDFKDGISPTSGIWS
jgi:KAP-like P-loop domain-containing protein